MKVIRSRCRAVIGLALGAVLGFDAWLLLRATVADVQDAVPSRAELIVLEAWSSDATTRLAFALAQRFDEAVVMTVGAGASLETATDSCFPGASVGEMTRAQLIAWGLAPGRVVDLGQRERGTHNEALRVDSWMKRHASGATSLVVVTEDFHRQRSRLTYRNTLRHVDVRVLGPQLGARRSDEPWWGDRRRLTALVSEYVKLCYYQLRGWISPIQLVDDLM